MYGGVLADVESQTPEADQATAVEYHKTRPNPWDLAMAAIPRPMGSRTRFRCGLQFSPGSFAEALVFRFDPP